MARTERLIALVVIGLLIGCVGIDVLRARNRLSRISIEGQLDPPKVVADGKHTTVLTVRVSENGQPRRNVLLQAWLETGGGLLIPEWVYTDDDGQARISYTPSAASVYDVGQAASLHVMDTSVGRLIEVPKHYTLEVPLEIPAVVEFRDELVK